MLESILPDITTHSLSPSPSRLHWVGMENIAIPITIATENNTQRISAKAGVYVSLNTPSVKGIHMSRLYLLINQLAQRSLLREDINSLLIEMIDSQKGISKEAKITLNFDLLIKKYALLSDESGYQAYPVTITAASIKGEHHISLISQSHTRALVLAQPRLLSNFKVQQSIRRFLNLLSIRVPSWSGQILKTDWSQHLTANVHMHTCGFN